MSYIFEHEGKQYTPDGAVNVAEETFNKTVELMNKRRELLEQARNPRLTLAQKLELRRQALAIDPMAD
jgi:hypothetical protein